MFGGFGSPTRGFGSVASQAGTRIVPGASGTAASVSGTVSRGVGSGIQYSATTASRFARNNPRIALAGATAVGLGSAAYLAGEGENFAQKIQSGIGSIFDSAGSFLGDSLSPIASGLASGLSPILLPLLLLGGIALFFYLKV